MKESNYDDGDYGGDGWVCNTCGGIGYHGSYRWVCQECVDDYCFTCKPTSACRMDYACPLRDFCLETLYEQTTNMLLCPSDRVDLKKEARLQLDRCVHIVTNVLEQIAWWKSNTEEQHPHHHNHHNHHNTPHHTKQHPLHHYASKVDKELKKKIKFTHRFRTLMDDSICRGLYGHESNAVRGVLSEYGLAFCRGGDYSFMLHHPLLSRYHTEYYRKLTFLHCQNQFHLPRINQCKSSTFQSKHNELQKYYLQQLVTHAGRLARAGFYFTTKIQERKHPQKWILNQAALVHFESGLMVMVPKTTHMTDPATPATIADDGYIKALIHHPFEFLAAHADFDRGGTTTSTHHRFLKGLATANVPIDITLTSMQSFPQETSSSHSNADLSTDAADAAESAEPSSTMSSGIDFVRAGTLHVAQPRMVLDHQSLSHVSKGAFVTGSVHSEVITVWVADGAEYSDNFNSMVTPLPLIRPIFAFNHKDLTLGELPSKPCPMCTVPNCSLAQMCEMCGSRLTHALLFGQKHLFQQVEEFRNGNLHIDTEGLHIKTLNLSPAKVSDHMDLPPLPDHDTDDDDFNASSGESNGEESGEESGSSDGGGGNYGTPGSSFGETKSQKKKHQSIITLTNTI